MLKRWSIGSMLFCATSAFGQITPEKLNDANYIRENFSTIIQQYEAERAAMNNHNKTLAPLIEGITNPDAIDALCDMTKTAKEKTDLSLDMVNSIAAKNDYAREQFVKRFALSAFVKNPHDYMWSYVKKLSRPSIDLIFNEALAGGGVESEGKYLKLLESVVKGSDLVTVSDLFSVEREVVKILENGRSGANIQGFVKVMIAGSKVSPSGLDAIRGVFTSNRISVSNRLAIVKNIQESAYGGELNPASMPPKQAAAVTTFLVDAATLGGSATEGSGEVNVAGMRAILFIASGRDTSFNEPELERLRPVFVGSEMTVREACKSIVVNVHPVGLQKLATISPVLKKYVKQPTLMGTMCSILSGGFFGGR